MKNFTLSADVKDMFFDRERVLKQIRQEDARRLSKAGAYIRQRAITSMRRRKRSARPGSPPSVHSRDAFASLRNILFALSSDWESVVIGPRGIPSMRLRGASVATVPELMEKGGAARVRGRRVRYAKFPFMRPALEKEVAAGTIGSLWVNRK